MTVYKANASVQCNLQSIYDPTYEVVTCINNYLNKEKKLLELLLDLKTVTSKYAETLLFQQIKDEFFATLQLHNWNTMDVFSSDYLKGNTTAFTLYKIAQELSKQLNQNIYLYVTIVEEAYRSSKFFKPLDEIEVVINGYLKKTLLFSFLEWKKVIERERLDDVQHAFMYFDQNCIALDNFLQNTYDALNEIKKMCV